MEAQNSDITIKASFDNNCYVKAVKNNIHFDIINNENESFYIVPGYLSFWLQLLDSSNNKLEPLFKIEANPLDLPKFIFVKANLTTRITYKTEVIDRFKVSEGEEYRLELRYRNKYTKNKCDRKYKTLMGEIEIASLYFQLCD